MNILNNFPLGLTIFSAIVIIGLGIYLYLTYEKPKIKKILILGSKGKIGSFLVNRLANYEIIEVDIDDNLVEAINQNPDLIIDFSTVSSSMQMFKLAIPLHIPLISGVTGFTEDDLKEIYELAKRYQTSVIIKPNFSEGIKYILVAEMGKKCRAIFRWLNLKIFDVRSPLLNRRKFKNEQVCTRY